MNEANEAIEERREGRVVPVSELHRTFGYAVSAIEGFIAEGAPVAKRGGPGVPHKIDTAKFHTWLMRRAREKVRAEYEGKDKGDDPKDRILRSKARTGELELARLEGELVEVEAVEALFANLVGNARARLLAIPNRLAPVLTAESDATKIKAELENAVYDALEELAAADPAAMLVEGADGERMKDAG